MLTSKNQWFSSWFFQKEVKTQINVSTQTKYFIQFRCCGWNDAMLQFLASSNLLTKNQKWWKCIQFVVCFLAQRSILTLYYQNVSPFALIWLLQVLDSEKSFNLSITVPDTKHRKLILWHFLGRGKQRCDPLSSKEANTRPASFEGCHIRVYH